MLLPAFDAMVLYAGGTGQGRRATPESFWVRVDKNGPVPASRPELGQCWNWLGQISKSGYGSTVRWCGTYVAPHRLAYSLEHGAIEKDRILRQMCGNRICCRPSHIEYRAIRMADCHPDRKHAANGLCDQCYDEHRRHSDPERHRKRVRAHRVGWVLKNPRLAKDRNLRASFGISIEQYETIVEAQGNMCAICRTMFGGSVKPFVDHNHDTSVVRGVLCQNCNFLLGHAHENLAVLEAAAVYLRKFSTEEVPNG